MNKHRLTIAKTDIKKFSSLTRHLFDKKTEEFEAKELTDSEIERNILMKLRNLQTDNSAELINFIDKQISNYKQITSVSNMPLYYYGMIGALIDIKQKIFNFMNFVSSKK